MLSDRAAVRAIELTEREIENFALKLEKVLSRTLSRIVAGLKANKVGAKNAAAVLGDMWGQLQAEGLADLMPEIEKIYARRLQRIASDLMAAGADKTILAGISTQDIETLIRFDVTKVTSTLKNYIDDTKAHLMRQVLTGSEFDNKDLLDRVESTAQSRVLTELNTMSAMFDRTVTTSIAAELGFELMIYLGPSDSITRPFCQACLEGSGSSEFSIPDTGINIYTLDQIDAMNNGQGLPVMTSGGGYNCRHQWRPISQKDAEARGWKP